MIKFKLPQMILMDFPCPHCKEKIIIPRCSYCKYVKRNYLNYAEAIKCRQCDMLHSNFEYNPNAQEDYEKIVEEIS